MYNKGKIKRINKMAGELKSTGKAEQKIFKYTDRISSHLEKVYLGDRL